jgi:hypothetical protein
MSTEAKCNCQYCNGHIAFPAEMAGQMSACPHCGQETKLYVAAVPNDIPVDVKRRKIYFAIVPIIVGIVAFAVYWISFSGHSVEWSKSPVVTQGDIKVAIKRVSFPNGTPVIRIELSIANLSTTKKVDFTGWSGVQPDGSSASLTDNNQNGYRLISDGVSPDNSIYPQQETSDTIAFETPVDNIQWLHLELPAKNFRGGGMLRFEFSIDKIKAALEEVGKAQTDYNSWVAKVSGNDSYLTNADFLKIVEKRDALVKTINTLQQQGRSPDQKTWSDLETVNIQFYQTRANAISSGNGMVVAAQQRLLAAETNFQVSPQ